MREHHSSKCLDEWLQIGVIGICDAGYMPRPQNDVSGFFVGRNGGLNAEVHSKISFLTAAAAVLILIGIETWLSVRTLAPTDRLAPSAVNHHLAPYG
jgi:hypothetical protein